MSKDARTVLAAAGALAGALVAPPKEMVTSEEPTAEQLAARPRTLVFDRVERCWMHKDPVRRVWLPRPETPLVVKAALDTLGPKLCVLKLGSVELTLRRLADGEHVWPNTLDGVGSKLWLLADAADELDFKERKP